ncbi:hypothetical protein C8J56DRAFT_1052377 [Mycena floridula]|nr:hypothetical protein C8J56DRAFT_1052377 [Mycena floridula]
MLNLVVKTLVFVLAAVSIASAASTPARDVVYHCSLDGVTETCPVGYRCCGPFFEPIGGTTFSGTCHQGTTGVCPL